MAPSNSVSVCDKGSDVLSGVVVLVDVREVDKGRPIAGIGSVDLKGEFAHTVVGSWVEIIRVNAKKPLSRETRVMGVTAG